MDSALKVIGSIPSPCLLHVEVSLSKILNSWIAPEAASSACECAWLVISLVYVAPSLTVWMWAWNGARLLVTLHFPGSATKKSSSHSKETCLPSCTYPKDKVNPRSTAQPLLSTAAKSLASLYNDDSFHATQCSHSPRLPLFIAFPFDFCPISLVSFDEPIHRTPQHRPKNAFHQRRLLNHQQTQLELGNWFIDSSMCNCSNARSSSWCWTHFASPSEIISLVFFQFLTAPKQTLSCWKQGWWGCSKVTRIWFFSNVTSTSRTGCDMFASNSGQKCGTQSD